MSVVVASRLDTGGESWLEDGTEPGETGARLPVSLNGSLNEAMV